MIWSIAWKNVWRNKKRSLIVICAVTLGTIAGVFTAGLMKGWIDQRVESIVHTEVSHIKIHKPDYLLNEEIKHTIPEINKVEGYLNNNEQVKAYTKRLKMMAMAGTARGNTALMLHGIDIEQEKAVSDVYTKIVPNGGSFLTENSRNPIVISDNTAETLRIKYYRIDKSTKDSLLKQEVDPQTVQKLDTLKDERYKTEKLFKKALKTVLSSKEEKNFGQIILESSKHYRLRSKIVFTFNDAEGKLVYQTFKVVGIYKTSSAIFDQMTAFVLKDDLIPVAGFQAGECHEIAMILKDEVSEKEVKEDIKSEFPMLSAMTWKDISPEAAMMTKFMDLWYMIVMIIILAALAFGIINTMLMAILERVKELGMLMAVGMNKRRVFSMIMLETIFLTLVGAVIGMVLGAIIIAITHHTGLNFASAQQGLEAIGWSAKVYPSIDAPFFLMVTGLVILTGILSSITPARKALKLNPIEAIRTE